MPLWHVESHQVSPRLLVQNKEGCEENQKAAGRIQRNQVPIKLLFSPSQQLPRELPARNQKTYNRQQPAQCEAEDKVAKRHAFLPSHQSNLNCAALEPGSPFRITGIAPAMQSNAWMSAEVCKELAEKVLHLVQQPRCGWLVFHRQRVAEFRNQFALRAGQLLWYLHHNPDDQVAAALLIHVRPTFAANAQLFSALRAFGNFQHHGTVHPGNLDVRSQRCLRKADGNHAVQVLPFALEEVVLAN